MNKKIFILGAIGILSGLSSVSAAESVESVGALAPAVVGHRFNCTFEGPAVIVKGAVPLVCTAFGEFTNPGVSPAMQDGDHLTVICGNTVLYSDGDFAAFPSNNAVEIRSVVPNAAIITVRTLTPGVFTGPLGSILRIDIPGTPNALLTGVCHLNPRVLGGPAAELYDVE